MTIPRIAALLTAQAERRRLELREMAIAVNLAMHNPKGIDKAFPPDPQARPTEDDERAPVVYADGEDDEWLEQVRAAWEEPM